MPALLVDPNEHDLPTYPPRPLQSRSSSTSTNDSGVIITPRTSSTTPSIVDSHPSLSTSPEHGPRTNSLSSERSSHHSPSLFNEETNSVLSTSVTVLKSQPFVASSLFEFPIKDDDTPCNPCSNSSFLERKLGEIFDTPESGTTSGSGLRSVNRGRSIKRSINWESTPGSPNREDRFSGPLEESSCFPVSPIPGRCPVLVASTPSTSPLSSPLCSLPSLEFSKSSPPPLIFEPLGYTALPSPPPVTTTSVIPTLSPRTILNGLGYDKSAQRFQPGDGGMPRFPEAYQTMESYTSSRYYFNDGNVVFQVRNKLYKVHRYFFEQNSLTMTVMISHVLERVTLMTRGTAAVNVANFPVILPDTEPVDFERLLSIFYPKDYSQHDAQTVEDWTSILRVSSRFGLTKIRSLALDNLYMTANAVEKIALNNEFRFDDVDIEDEWVLDAYVELVTRIEPLTLQEGEKIGMRDVIRIQAMKAGLIKDLRKYLDMESVKAMVEAYL